MTTYFLFAGYIRCLIGVLLIVIDTCEIDCSIMSWNGDSNCDSFILKSSINELISPDDIKKKNVKTHGLTSKDDFATSESLKNKSSISNRPPSVNNSFKKAYSLGLTGRGLGRSGTELDRSRSSANATPKNENDRSFNASLSMKTITTGNPIKPGATLGENNSPSPPNRFRKIGMIPHKENKHSPSAMNNIGNIALHNTPNNDKPKSIPSRKVEGQKRGHRGAGDALAKCNVDSILANVSAKKTRNGKISSHQEYQTQRRKSSRLKLNQDKAKNQEVIELLDDSDSDDGDISSISSQYKQKLANTVKATFHKPVHDIHFGELETLPLKELYIGNVRFAYTAVSEDKLLSARSTRAAKRKLETANASESSCSACEITVNNARSLFRLSLPRSADANDLPLRLKEEIPFQHIQHIRLVFMKSILC